MPNKWTGDEEIKLIEMFREKKSIDEIAVILNRTPNAIEQRINKIIYENYKKSGKPLDQQAKSLNITVDEVIKHVNLRESFIKQKLNGIKKELGSNISSKNLSGGSLNESVINPSKTYLNDPVNDNSFEINQEKLIVLKKIEYENRFIKAVIENKILHKQLNDLIKKGKIDSNVTNFLKKLHN